MAASSIEAVVIGGSAGALDALELILPALPSDFPLSIALVLHVPPRRPNLTLEALSRLCSLEVREPEDKEPFQPGTLYVAPPDYHLLVERRRTLSLSVDEPVNFSRPSIDVLFESAASAYGPGLLGVLLSGASPDGARGLAAIRARGGTVVVQAPASATVTVMPEAGLRAAAADYVLDPRAIGSLCAGLPGSFCDSPAPVLGQRNAS